MPSPYNDYYSTAYHGSQGHIDDRSLLSLDLDRDGYDALQLPEPAKAATPTRPALSARLMSTWSNAQPAAAALSRKGSVLHSRAKSLAGFMPKLNASTTTSTPERFDDGQQRQSVFSNLFSGESAPIRLGVPLSPTKEKEEMDFVMEYKSSFTERPTGPRRRSSAFIPASTNTTSPSTKSSWFSRKSSVPASPPRIQEEADELLTLNLNTALFPHGPADPLSPHAFNDLLLNATSLLTRMQTAYKDKVEYIASIQPEIDAQAEEAEEAETRAQHLKLQLEELSRKSEEQNQAMREMAAMLAEEKMRNVESRSVKLVRRGSAEQADEDDTPRRAKRSSGGSGSDSGFESDVDYADSVISGGGRETPTMVLTPAYDGQEWDLGTSALGYHGLRNETQASRPSMRDLPGTTIFSARRAGSGGSGEGAAWDTVDALRGENKDLRRRVEGMEREMQGVIDLVGATIRG
ncbi:hypothetical protein LTR78_006495 [Recurvomyces mirabilis]|uniref:Uncharacterized protein n=1 Tax=Recurvomyces mirabilis TaxID=574656 RepID=A0AAE0WKX0_9PEZI|nr:hypothetical protein LTR78_006495 [Recurvomyces mirabilis]KAK5151087.1 hypothetical protein LTS14_009582 [Recurvomyces mirabilis]